MDMTRILVRAAAALALCALAGCIVIGDEDEPIEMLVSPAPEPSPQPDAVVVLPGMGADAKAMRERGVDAAVHRAWPRADVLLTSATLAYYVHRVVVPRLESDVLAPARRRYRRIWLAGASVGGMGAMQYEMEHPGAVTGLVFLAPWLGNDDLIEEIRRAGLTHWDPGPKPDVIHGDNYQREMWRVIKGWSTNPAQARRVWLVCGTEDRLITTARLLATALPPSHYLEVEGAAHTWDAFLNSAAQIMARIREENEGTTSAKARAQKS